MLICKLVGTEEYTHLLQSSPYNDLLWIALYCVA